MGLTADLLLAGTLAIIALVAMYFALRKPQVHHHTGSGVSAVERRFKNVHAMVTPERREAIIQHYMDHRGCSTREEAMMRVMDENTRDRDRW